MEPSLERAAGQVLAELELTSVTRARTLVVLGGARPSGSPPVGDGSPAQARSERFAAAGDDAERALLVAGAREELELIRRRKLPLRPVVDAEDLRERILRDGEGLTPLELFLAVRCTPTLIRRTRLASGRDAERGHPVELEALEPAALVALGLSLRQVAAVLGVSKSVVHSRVRPAAA